MPPLSTLPGLPQEPAQQQSNELTDAELREFFDRDDFDPSVLSEPEKQRLLGLTEQPSVSDPSGPTGPPGIAGGLEAVTGAGGLFDLAGQALTSPIDTFMGLRESSPGFKAGADVHPLLGPVGMMLEGVGRESVQNLSEVPQAFREGRVGDAAISTASGLLPLASLIPGLGVPARAAAFGGGMVLDEVRDRFFNDDFGGAAAAAIGGFGPDLLLGGVQPPTRPAGAAGLLARTDITPIKKTGFLPQFVEKTIPGAPVFDRAVRRQNRQFLTQTVETVADEISGVRGPRSVIGPQVRERYNAAYDSANDAFTQRYTELRARDPEVISFETRFDQPQGRNVQLESIPNRVVDVRGVKAEAAKVLSEIDRVTKASDTGSGGIAPGALAGPRQAAEAIMNATGRMSFTELQTLRSKLIRMGDTSELVANELKSTAKRFTEEVHEAMEEAATRLDPSGDMLKTVRELNNEYAAFRTNFDSTLFTRIMQTGSPEALTEAVRTAGATQVEEMVKFLTKQDPLALEMIRGRVFEDIMSESLSPGGRQFRASSAQPEGVVLGERVEFTGTSDPGVSSQRLEGKISPFAGDINKELKTLYSPEQLQLIFDLKEAAELVGPVPSGTAGLVAGAFNAALLGTAAALPLGRAGQAAAPIAAATGLTRIAAMAMTSPTVLKSTVDLFKAMRGTVAIGVPQATQKLGMVLNRWAQERGINVRELAQLNQAQTTDSESGPPAGHPLQGRSLLDLFSGPQGLAGPTAAATR